MIIRRLFKAFVFILAILSVNLLSNYIDNYLIGYQNQYKPIQFTLLGMAIIVLIFFPLFNWLNTWVENASHEFLRLGKAMAGRKVGLILAFMTALYGLFYLYARMWFGTNINPVVWAELKKFISI